MKTKDWMVALALGLCVVGLVACGGGGGENASGSGSGSGSGGGAGSDEEAALEFTECMRAHGVDVEDPKPGQTNIELGDKGDPVSKEALAACNDKLGSAGQELSAEEDEEFKEGALALARCMREQGIEMGDPEFRGPGQFLLDIEGIDTESPAFKAAQEACDGLLPETSGITVGG